MKDANDSDIIGQVLKASGFNKTNPVQRMALDAGLLGGKNGPAARPQGWRRPRTRQIRQEWRSQYAWDRIPYGPQY